MLIETLQQHSNDDRLLEMKIIAGIISYKVQWSYIPLMTVQLEHIGVQWGVGCCVVCIALQMDKFPGY